MEFPAFPALFEVDGDTHEATGTVHLYCSEECRAAGWSQVQPAAGTHLVEGDSDPEDWAVCEGCGARLEMVVYRDTTVREIARRILSIGTLDTRNSDSLDFHEVGVDSLKKALEEAFAAGAEWESGE